MRNLRMLYVAKGIIVNPLGFIIEIKSKKFSYEICLFYFFSLVVTFLKGFFVESKVMTFYQSQKVNEVMSFINNPNIKLLIMNFIYFIFIIAVYLICKIFKSKPNFRLLIFSLLSLSVVGIYSQIAFFVFKYVISKKILFIMSYIVYLWVAYLSVQSIKITQDLNVSKSLLCFAASAIVFILIMGLPTVAPYLVWLTV